MSVKMIGMVWDAPLPRDEKFILLAYADHADHDGGSIFPSKERIERMTGYSRRSVQTITAKLVADGIMVEDGERETGVKIYRLDVLKLLHLSWGAQNLHPAQKTTKGAQKTAAEGRKKQQAGGANSAPNPSIEPPVEPSEEPPVVAAAETLDLFTPKPAPAPAPARHWADLPDVLSQYPELVEAWAEWKLHRKEKRTPLTEQSAKRQIVDMVAWGPGKSVAAIHHSIKAGYQGLFAPKDWREPPAAKPTWTAANVLSLPKKP